MSDESDNAQREIERLMGVVRHVNSRCDHLGMRLGEVIRERDALRALLFDWRWRGCSKARDVETEAALGDWRPNVSVQPFAEGKSAELRVRPGVTKENQMGDTEQDAINALRAAGLEREAAAIEDLRARHKRTMDAYHAGQRASYADGRATEYARCKDLVRRYMPAGWSAVYDAIAEGADPDAAVGSLKCTEGDCCYYGQRRAETCDCARGA